MESTFYPYLGALGWIGLFLLVGTVIRAKVKFFQKLLFPASLIGGIIGFIFLNAGWLGIPSSTGWKTITPVVFSTITFHLFAFGFMGIGLLQAKSGTDNKVVARGALWIALIFGLLFSVQALVGKGTFDVWKLLFGGDFFTGNGYLLGAGFTQGSLPDAGVRQHLGTYLQDFQFHQRGPRLRGRRLPRRGRHRRASGLLRHQEGLGCGRRRRQSSSALPARPHGQGRQPGLRPQHHASGQYRQRGLHLAIIAALYAAAYAFGVWWLCNMPKGINGLGIGMIFAWGMFFAMIARKIMGKIGILHLIDGETTRRLTGSTVDSAIRAVFMGIQVRQLQDVAWPFLIAVVLGSIATLVICLWFGRRSPEYGFERGLTLFGYCTGTAASGLLLLRIVDPDFDTPVAVEVGPMNVFAVIFKPVSWSMPFVPVEGFPMVWIFVGMTVITPIVMYFLKMIRKPAF